MRTTIDIPDSLFHQAKALAARRKTTMRTLILEGLRRVIGESRARAAFELRDLSYGEGGLVDDLTPTDWERIRDRIYEGRGGDRG